MSQNLRPSQQRWALWLALTSAPFGVTVLLALMGWIPVATVGSTFVGVIGATVGGITSGVTAWRFLARPRNDGEAIFGVLAVTAIGVVAIGYIYLVHLNQSTQTITRPERIVEQTASFLTFVAAQSVGILWAKRIFSEPQRGPRQYGTPDGHHAA